MENINTIEYWKSLSLNWIHKKSGGVYVIESIVLNKTDDSYMMLYHAVGNDIVQFVRTIENFSNSFEPKNN